MDVYASCIHMSFKCYHCTEAKGSLPPSFPPSPFTICTFVVFEKPDELKLQPLSVGEDTEVTHESWAEGKSWKHYELLHPLNSSSLEVRFYIFYNRRTLATS